MGRPLNKKYFGNRNTGAGGEGIASYTLPGQLGSIEVDSDSGQPTLTIPAPTLPGGVQATATVTWEIESITITAANGTGYTNGETVNITGATGATATIVVDTDNITTITPVLRGSFTTITPNSTNQLVGVTSAANDAYAEVRYRVKTIAMTAQGSGYITAPTLSWAAGLAGPISGTSPGAPTAVLTTANSENAIVIRAKTTSGGTSQVGDIVKQEASRRYKVTTADGTAVCRLVADDTPAFKEAYIVATSAAGGTYYVIKLTAHRALLVAKAGDSALAGKSVQWTFGSPSGSIVQIENA
jgi:hypothetical protein